MNNQLKQTSAIALHIFVVLMMCRSAALSAKSKKFFTEEGLRLSKIIKKLEPLMKNHYIKEITLKEDTSQEHQLGSTEIFKGHIKKGAIVYDIKSDEPYLISRDLYVLAQTRAKISYLTYLYDKEGKKIKFIALSEDVQNVTQQLKTTATPQKLTTYPPNTTKYLLDKHLILQNSINMHFEFINIPYLSELFGTKTGMVSGNRIEFKSFYDWDFPINLGMSLSVATSTWLEDESEMSWTATYLGPVARLDIKFSDTFDLSFQFSFQKALNSKASNMSSAFLFYNDVIQLGIEGIYETQFGNIIFGLNYRQQKLKLKKDNYLQVSTTTSEQGTLFSIGGAIGYGFDIDL
ncbi:MAG: hypothetical protein ISR65_06660 [Bacteriovoracaceae bacterium]|nr:hypothetical protein [Bacteriovoracaceae bacterium]